jgi:DNA transposition AAA+ family ATPase
MSHSAPSYDQHAHDIRAQLQRYLDRSGLTHGDFARRIGYSTVAIHLFIQGRYQGNPKHICAASKDFMALHPVAQPPSTATGALYETQNVRAWREIFYECLDRARAAVVYGPPGIQKSFPVENLIAELNASELRDNKTAKGGRRATRSAYYIYCRQGIRPNQLMKRIAEACGSSPLGDADRILRNLRFDFGTRRVLLVFDEAQHLDVNCLETVRELLDRLGCGLIFSGSHDLFRLFEKTIELEQWNRRLRHAVALPGMTDEDARRIIACELGEIKAKQIESLIEGARVDDIRRKQKYISAGRLFSAIQEVQEDPRFQKQESVQ